jgi:hypothetical protein
MYKLTPVLLLAIITLVAADTVWLNATFSSTDSNHTTTLLVTEQNPGNDYEFRYQVNLSSTDDNVTYTLELTQSKQSDWCCETTTPQCSFCQAIVELIDHDIKSANETFAVIEEFVAVLCKVINPVVAPTCDAILKDLKTIFDWIVNGTYPTNEICQKLGLCPA